jgi:hypothetical protein
MANIVLVAGDPGWTVKTLPCGHNVVAEAPEQFLAVIADLKAIQRG